MTYSFHPLAKQELKEAVDYYNDCGSGLGYLFLEEVHAAINRIIQFPTAWSKLSKNVRRCITRRFPYGVIYREREEDILILAIMHLKRKPNYWKNRIEPED